MESTSDLIVHLVRLCGHLKNHMVSGLLFFKVVTAQFTMCIDIKLRLYLLDRHCVKYIILKFVMTVSSGYCYQFGRKNS